MCCGFVTYVLLDNPGFIIAVGSLVVDSQYGLKITGCVKAFKPKENYSASVRIKARGVGQNPYRKIVSKLFYIALWQPAFLAELLVVVTFYFMGCFTYFIAGNRL